jgi:beta-glucosidase
MTFPPNFIWGAATSSYQIEGGDAHDGRGECIWQRFSHTAGSTFQGDTGDTACDHYHRYTDDVNLLSELGVNSYRFSIAWARVLPTGTGTVNPIGLDFYDRLVDTLCEKNIAPMATLYHWDLPYALHQQGGWENPRITEWFAEYTGVVTRKLGDRVKSWLTINEPWCVAFLGYYFGIHAPGIKDDVRAAYKVAHHTLLAHAAAVPVIRANVQGASVGIGPNVYPVYAAGNSPEDHAAVRRADAFQNRWFLDPLFKGTYPADYVAWLNSTYPHVLEGLDLDAVKAAATPLDFLAINYYSRAVKGAGDDFLHSSTVQPAESTYTAMGWEVYPQGLTDILLRITLDYQPKSIVITENGASFDDPAPHNGEDVPDPERTAYLQAHLDAVHQAILRGAPVRGYYVWSFLDNFEWAEGYRKRFGIVHVDFATQKRTFKQSARFYQDWILEHSPVPTTG